MSYGFQIQNSSGLVIADDSSFSLALIASGSVTTDASGAGSITYPDVGEIPTIMIQSPAGGQWVGIGSISSSSCGFVSWTASGSYAILAREACTFNYRVYTRSNVAGAGAGDYGILMYNASGQVTFDSRQTTAPLNSVMNVMTPSLSGESTSFTYVSAALPSGAGSSCWHSLSGGNGAAGRQQTSGGIPPGGILYGHPSRVSGSNLQVAYMGLTVVTGGNSTWTPGGSYFIIN
jgi:hypothetical protein